MSIKLPKNWKVKKVWPPIILEYGCVKCINCFDEPLKRDNEKFCPKCGAKESFLRTREKYSLHSDSLRPWQPLNPIKKTCPDCEGSGIR